MATQSVTLQPGESKVVSFEFVPIEARTYQVSVDGLTGSFVATSLFLSGKILEVTWRDGQIWHPISDPMPQYASITLRFRVKNTGNGATFKAGYQWWDIFSERWLWNYSPGFNIGAGVEGNIDWILNTGMPQTTAITFYLFANNIEVDSTTVTITITAPPVDYASIQMQIAAINEQLYYMAGVYYGYYPPNENYVRIAPTYNFPIDWYDKTYNEMTYEEQLAFEARMRELEAELERLYLLL